MSSSYISNAFLNARDIEANKTDQSLCNTIEISELQHELVKWKLTLPWHKDIHTFLNQGFAYCSQLLLFVKKRNEPWICSCQFASNLLILQSVYHRKWRMNIAYHLTIVCQGVSGQASSVLIPHSSGGVAYPHGGSTHILWLYSFSQASRYMEF